MYFVNSFNDYNYFWIPIVACHIGGILGCWIYRLFIELHWPDQYDVSSGAQGGESEHISGYESDYYMSKIMARLNNQRV